MEQTQIAAIVLAAGHGSRMHSDIPKQYMQLAGYPLLYYSLKAFEESAVDRIVLVTGAEDIDYCQKKIVQQYGFRKVCAVVAGGAERYLSVYEGLKAAAPSDYVLIHDGARPMLDQESIQHSIQTVRETGACVLATMVKDTIKVADPEGYAQETPDRSTLWAVQTPQSFQYSLIHKAYCELFSAQQAGRTLPAITDDAMVVEQMTGEKVKLISGSYRNIKVTTPEDMQIAELFLKKDEKNQNN